MPLDSVSEVAGRPFEVTAGAGRCPVDASRFGAGRRLDPAVDGARRRGALNCLAGGAAEDAVARRLQSDGMELLERRWRGAGGEVDLILRDGDTLVFIEVKASETLEAAASRLTGAQIGRIAKAAEEYAGRDAATALSPIRIDGALVNARGEIEIVANISIL